MMTLVTQIKSYLHTLSMLLLGVVGFSILYTYVYYLNHTLLPVAPYRFSALWSHVKLIIFLWTFLVLLMMLSGINKRLQLKGIKVKQWAIFRSIMAALFFCISFTAYDPPLIDLTFYFFTNMIGYGMLGYAFFNLHAVKPLCEFLGKYTLMLLRLPAWCWVSVASVFVFSMAYHLSWVLFQHFPWIDDTISQLIHAKFMLEGKWFEQSHPLPRFFDTPMMINNGKWYSQYTPGHIFMLVIGKALKHHEMVNPFLGAATCAAVWLLAKELYGQHVAKIAVFLTGISSYLIIFSSEYMSNATSLLTGTLYLWAYFRLLHKPDKRYRFALLAGFMLGYCFITRPYSALGLSLATALYGAYLAVTRPRRFFIPMALIALVLGVFVLFQLYYNAATTGEIFKFGYQEFHGDKHNPFSDTAIDRYKNVSKLNYFSLNLQRLVYFNRIIFEWPVPSLALIAIIWAIRGHRLDERLLMYSIVSMFVSVQLIVHKDIGWGPRLLYEINGILLVLFAKALSILPPLLRVISGHSYRLRYYYGASLLILASFYAYAFQYNMKIKTIKEFYVLEEREGNPEFYKHIVSQVKQPALVFVPAYMYKFVSFTNPPSKNKPVIFARDLAEENKKLIAMYPKRNIYLVNTSGIGDFIVKIRQY